MRPTQSLFLALILLISVFITPPAAGGTQQLEEREWHGIDGSRIAFGEFIRLENQKVVIHNSEGIVSFPFGDISWKDKDFIRDHVRSADVQEGKEHKQESVAMMLILLGLLTGVIASVVSYIIRNARGEGAEEIWTATTEQSLAESE